MDFNNNNKKILIYIYKYFFILLNEMIKNKIQNKILHKKVKFCKTIFSQMRGFMFSKPNKALVFIFKKEKIANLHMFFILHPIDVLWLDKNKKVVKN